MEIINGIDQDDTGGDCTDIDGATIDDSVIGETTPAAAEFTNVGIGISNVSGTSLTLPIENDAVTPTLAFGDGDTGFYENTDDTIAIAINGSLIWEVTSSYIGSHSAEKPRILNTAASAIVPNIIPDGNDSNTGIGRAAYDQLSFIAGGVEGMRISEDTTITVDISGQLQGNLINNQMVQKAIFDILGLMTDPRCLYAQMEDPGAGTLYDASGNARNGTYQGEIGSGDRVSKGMGWALSFNSANHHVSLGDSDGFSFGNGSNDEPTTWFGAAEVEDTGTTKTIISKYDNTTGTREREWKLVIGADEKMVISLVDESVDIIISSTTDNTISVGYHTFAVTYDGAGGATAANTIKFYIDGKIVSSTATNNASYVAMENTVASCLVGVSVGASGAVANYMHGDIALLGLDGSEWSAYDVHRFHQLCKGLYGI